MSTYKASDLGLKSLGLSDNILISRNLSYEDLVEDIIKNGEGNIASSGAAMIDSGEYTGRSPKDKYIVEEGSSSEKIWWGEVNQKLSEEVFDYLYRKVIDYYNNSKSEILLSDIKDYAIIPLGSLDNRRNAFINITNLIRRSSNGLG